MTMGSLSLFDLYRYEIARYDGMEICTDEAWFETFLLNDLFVAVIKYSMANAHSVLTKEDE